MREEKQMPEEGNKDLVRRWVKEAWIGHNPKAIPEFFARDYAVNGEEIGPEGVKRSVEWLMATFGDPSVDIDDLVAEGDKVVMRWTLRGEHVGVFLGVAPTGRTIELRGINVYRMAGGRIAENHEVVDIHGLLRQLGIAPA